MRYIALCPICRQKYTMSEMQDHLDNDHKPYQVTRALMQKIGFQKENLK